MSVDGVRNDICSYFGGSLPVGNRRQRPDERAGLCSFHRVSDFYDKGKSYFSSANASLMRRMASTMFSSEVA